MPRHQWQPKERKIESKWVVERKPVIPPSDEEKPAPPRLKQPKWLFALGSLLSSPRGIIAIFILGGAGFFGLFGNLLGFISISVWAACWGIIKASWRGAIIWTLTAWIVLWAWWPAGAIALWLWYDGINHSHTRWDRLLEWTAGIGFASWLAWRMGEWIRCSEDEAVCQAQWFDSTWMAGGALALCIALSLYREGRLRRGHDTELRGIDSAWALGAGVLLWASWVWTLGDWTAPQELPQARLAFLLYGGGALWWFSHWSLARYWSLRREKDGKYA